MREEPVALPREAGDEGIASGGVGDRAGLGSSARHRGLRASDRYELADETSHPPHPPPGRAGACSAYFFSGLTFASSKAIIF